MLSVYGHVCEAFSVNCVQYHSIFEATVKIL